MQRRRLNDGPVDTVGGRGPQGTGVLPCGKCRYRMHARGCCSGPYWFGRSR